MSQHQPQTFTAFEGQRRLASGPLHRGRPRRQAGGAARRGDDRDFQRRDGTCHRPRSSRLRRRDRGAAAATPARRHLRTAPSEPRGRGRPKLGVVAREVTLLPRHWEWLNAQPGGASVSFTKTGRGGAPRQWRQGPQPRRARCGLSFHVGDGRQPAELRGGVARAVRGRPAAVRGPDRGMARRYPRSHRQARIQRAIRLIPRM